MTTIALGPPSHLDYARAIANPATAFTHPVLRLASLEMRGFLPYSAAGNFASVFLLKSANGRRHGVKCFTRNADKRKARYRAINEALRPRPAWAVAFEFLPRGILVEGRHHPIVKMEWLRGQTLDTFVAGSGGDATLLAPVIARWLALVDEMEIADIAHGDLQHGNVIITPSKAVKLVDYDGMFVPTLRADLEACELGLPAFQSPLRRQADFGPGMDRHAAWVIYASLLTASRNWPLYQEFSDDDRLLFDEQDLLDPESSAAVDALRTSGDSVLRELGHALTDVLGMPPVLVPPLRDVELAPSTLPGWIAGRRHVDEAGHRCADHMATCVVCAAEGCAVCEGDGTARCAACRAPVRRADLDDDGARGWQLGNGVTLVVGTRWCRATSAAGTTTDYVVDEDVNDPARLAARALARTHGYRPDSGVEGAPGLVIPGRGKALSQVVLRRWLRLRRGRGRSCAISAEAGRQLKTGAPDDARPLSTAPFVDLVDGLRTAERVEAPRGLRLARVVEAARLELAEGGLLRTVTHHEAGRVAKTMDEQVIQFEPVEGCEDDGSRWLGTVETDGVTAVLRQVHRAVLLDIHDEGNDRVLVVIDGGDLAAEAAWARYLLRRGAPVGAVAFLHGTSAPPSAPSPDGGEMQMTILARYLVDAPASQDGRPPSSHHATVAGLERRELPLSASAHELRDLAEHLLAQVQPEAVHLQVARDVDVTWKDLGETTRRYTVLGGTNVVPHMDDTGVASDHFRVDVHGHLFVPTPDAMCVRCEAVYCASCAPETLHPCQCGRGPLCARCTAHATDGTPCPSCGRLTCPCGVAEPAIACSMCGCPACSACVEQEVCPACIGPEGWEQVPAEAVAWYLQSPTTRRRARADGGSIYTVVAGRRRELAIVGRRGALRWWAESPADTCAALLAEGLARAESAHWQPVLTEDGLDIVAPRGRVLARYPVDAVAWSLAPDTLPADLRPRGVASVVRCAALERRLAAAAPRIDESNESHRLVLRPRTTLDTPPALERRTVNAAVVIDVSGVHIFDPDAWLHAPWLRHDSVAGPAFDASVGGSSVAMRWLDDAVRIDVQTPQGPLLQRTRDPAILDLFRSLFSA